MEFEKQDINIGKTVFEGEINASAEGNIIVPDVKPDILKVLQVSAEPYLCEKIIENGKLTLKGRVRINALYLPEGGCNIQCLNGVFEFCETLKKAEFTSNMKVCALCDADKVTYKPINSRKLGIEVRLLIGVSVFENVKISVVGENCCKELQTRYKDISLCSEQNYRDFEFGAEEEMELPKGKSACEVLRGDLCIASKEYRILGEKLVLKGRITANILYVDKEGFCAHIEGEIPFTEVFETEEISEETDCTLNFEIGDTSFEIVGAEKNSISVNAKIKVGIKTEQTKSISVVDDCYFTDSECEIIKEDISISETISKVEYSANLKQLLQKETNMPDITGVYLVQAKPSISASAIQNGRLSISGKVLIYVLYTTDNKENPVGLIKEEAPYNYNLDCEGNIKEGNDTILEAKCENLSYSINSKSSVEVRLGIFISGRVVKSGKESFITDLKKGEDKKKNKGIAVCFLKQDDSLWEIAKKYGVKEENIMLLNGMENEFKPADGDKIIIPM